MLISLCSVSTIFLSIRIHFSKLFSSKFQNANANFLIDLDYSDNFHFIPMFPIIVNKTSTFSDFSKKDK